MATAGDHLAAFIRESPIHRAPIARAVGSAAATLAEGTRVLDAGAGRAPYRLLFSHCEYVTQDWPQSLHAAARSADIVADLRDLPVADASFGFVLCTEVLEHVADPARVLGELRRVLRVGGRLLVTVPFVGELHEEPHDHWRYTNHGLAGLLARSGFEQIAVTPLTGYWSTVAQVLRHAGLATRPVASPARPATRAAALASLCVSGVLQRLAPTLDRLDGRRALPLGWVATAVASGPA
jgi:SAM-dependent methyltransferase